MYLYWKFDACLKFKCNQIPFSFAKYRNLTFKENFFFDYENNTCLIYNLGHTKAQEKESNNSYVTPWTDIWKTSILVNCGLFLSMLRSEMIFLPFYARILYFFGLTLDIIPPCPTFFSIAAEASASRCVCLCLILCPHVFRWSLKWLLKLFQVKDVYNHGNWKVMTFNVSRRLFSKSLVGAVKASLPRPAEWPCRHSACFHKLMFQERKSRHSAFVPPRATSTQFCRRPLIWTTQK